MQYPRLLFQLAAAFTCLAVNWCAAFSLPGEIDVDAFYSRSTFPVPPADLIARAKQVLSPQVGIGTKDGGKCLADDFEFCAAVVGPIPKEDYLGALKSFSLDVAFDIQQNYYGFYVDPLQTNRVWFFTRQVAKHVAEFAGVKPTRKELTLPPQLMHLDFNDDGLVKEFGFYTVDRRQGNTGGLGGAFGYFYGVGKPLPIREAKPYKPSFRFKMLQLLGALAKKFKRNKE
mmetsp:Transcript_12138/g.22730  ORF Transcript_12138/g.22730 Transcript_12138/m.22730 type:complete len:229 (-) Transcript_12138:101-787(-)|eukprot:CAMPEP_0176497866 /NCGR_PEP_ID=MMETSP0200_2-20121128/11981_1 /TAXON_ID=947934 /ORGANISM="Chaetoceros sp., Strain GSL56" /LENGTH=228 /DNA_ID=CAMNT_0017895965 /DNA_START=67 /DNA_END=753 /DNA_ORIENTATION=-